jgi:hypothetical protein
MHCPCSVDIALIKRQRSIETTRPRDSTHRGLRDAQALPQRGDGGGQLAARGGAAVELGGAVADARVELLDPPQREVRHRPQELGLRSVGSRKLVT